jgi:uncharacterized protein
MNSPAPSIAAEKYVAITTTKRNGDAVTSPVWIAGLPDGSLGFTTDLTSGKVKRIRNFPEVTLQPCNARGAIKPGSTLVHARATVLTDTDIADVTAAIKAKYGFMVSTMNALYSVREFFSRKPGSPAAAIRLELVEPAR